MIGFRPLLVPTICAATVVAVCLGLGMWQVQRMYWKRDLIAVREASLVAAPIPPPRTLEEARPLEFRHVSIDGVFLNDKELYLHAISDGGAQGYHVLTPLREVSGRVILIDRGFVPTELRDQARRRAGQPEGDAHLVGLLRLPPTEKPGGILSPFMPDNRADSNHWFWVDLPAMASADGLENAAPFYIDADKTANPGGWPRGGITRTALPDDHLQYAITWFLLAGAMIVIYVLYHRRREGAG